MRTTRYALAILGLVVLTASSVALSAQNGQQNGQGYGQGRGRGDQYSQMTGTYDLDTNRSDNAQRAADMATRGLPSGRATGSRSVRRTARAPRSTSMAEPITSWGPTGTR
jgi:hypothetical protein